MRRSRGMLLVLVMNEYCSDNFAECIAVSLQIITLYKCHDFKFKSIALCEESIEKWR